MIFTITQILGALAAVVGSVALFGPWWTVLVFGALTLLASTIAEALQAPRPTASAPGQRVDEDPDVPPPGTGELEGLRGRKTES